MYIDSLNVEFNSVDHASFLKPDGNITIKPIYKQNIITFNPIKFKSSIPSHPDLTIYVGTSANDTSFAQIPSTATTAIKKPCSVRTVNFYLKCEPDCEFDIEITHKQKNYSNVTISDKRFTLVSVIQPVVNITITKIRNLTWGGILEYGTWNNVKASFDTWGDLF